MVTVRESVEMRLDAVLMVFNMFWFFCPLCSILLYGFVLGLGLFGFFFCVLLLAVVRLLSVPTSWRSHDTTEEMFCPLREVLCLLVNTALCLWHERALSGIALFNYVPWGTNQFPGKAAFLIKDFLGLK